LGSRVMTKKRDIKNRGERGGIWALEQEKVGHTTKKREGNEIDTISKKKAKRARPSRGLLKK